MLILDEVTGGHLIAASVNIGTRWPVHATATGKAMLAAMPERVLESLEPLQKATDATITDMDKLRAELQRIRRRGYATAVGELEPGFVAIAAVVHGAFHNVEGALSLGGPANRLNHARRTELGAEVLAAAKRLARLTPE